MNDNDPFYDDARLEEAAEAIRSQSIPEDAVVRVEQRALQLPLTLQAAPVGRTPPLSPALSFFKRSTQMKSLVRYGVAAAVIFGIALVLHFGSNSNVLALGEVTQAVREHKFVQYKQTEITKNTSTTPGIPPGTESTTTQSTVYADLKGLRYRTEKDTWHDGTMFLNIEDYSNRKTLMVNPKERKATVNLLAEWGTKPKPMFEELEKLRENKNTKMTKEKLDGRDVLVYRLENKVQNKLTFGSVGSVIEPSTTTVWVEPETKLPVRIEALFVFPVAKINPSAEARPNPVPIDPKDVVYTEASIQLIVSDFVWDAEFKDADALFSLEPPEGYQTEIIDNSHPRTKMQTAPGE